MTAPARTLVHDRLATLADATRCRLLLALDGRELTVGELCQALQLPQSTVSRHLRVLADAGWTTSRADGASRWYAVEPGLDEEARELWGVVRSSVGATAAAVQDAARVQAVIAARRSRSEAYFADAAADWDRTRAALFGARSDLLAMLALADPEWTVGDLGCGTGALASSFAPFVRRVIAVDASPAMLDAARARTIAHPNVDWREGALEQLPVADGTLDLAVCVLVLHHVAEPLRVLREAHRALAPGGRLIVCDMRAHGREEYRQQMGHVWLGFERGTIAGWCALAGFERVHEVDLPADASVSGPTLCVVRAERPCAATAREESDHGVVIPERRPQP
jgi:ArsR family transcriptional regulator